MDKDAYIAAVRKNLKGLHRNKKKMLLKRLNFCNFKLMMSRIAKSMGCKEKPDARPYDTAHK